MAAVKRDTPEDLAERLDVVTRALSGLRRGGVTALKLGDLELAIEPLQPEPTRPGRSDDYDPETLDPGRFSRRPGPGGSDDDGDGE